MCLIQLNGLYAVSIMGTLFPNVVLKDLWAYIPLELPLFSVVFP